MIDAVTNYLFIYLLQAEGPCTRYTFKDEETCKQKSTYKENLL